jgi:hypothetical protein
MHSEKGEDRPQIIWGLPNVFSQTGKKKGKKEAQRCEVTDSCEVTQFGKLFDQGNSGAVVFS